MLSHELRNPLAALSGAAQILRLTKPGDPRALLASEIVDRQTRQMTRLVEDLLDIGRIVTGKATLNAQRLDLGQVVLELLDTWRANGRFSTREITCRADSGTILADRARIEQIVSNLLDNAIKFTAADGTIRVAVRNDGTMAELRIADDGEGMNAEILPRIFDLFVQGRQGLARDRGGLGIGLALVKRLAEMQGGMATASSRGAGRGSTFSVRFPVVGDSDETVPGSAAVAPSLPARKTRTILIVEDNDDTRQMLQHAFMLNGHRVEVAADGASGLASAVENKPEVVITDIGLPDIDGYELARRLRKHGHRSRAG